MSESNSRSEQYEEDSLSLTGSVAMGTGVMIGAGIFALTGQVAEQTDRWTVSAGVSGCGCGRGL